MWVRRVATGWRLAIPLQIAGTSVALGSGGVAILAAYATWRVGWAELIYVFPMIGLSYVMARTAFMGVDVLHEGITIRNPIRTTVVPWDRWTGVSVDKWRSWRCMGLVHREGAPPVPLGVFAVNPMYEDTHVDDVVRELGELAKATRTGGVSSDSPSA